LENYFRKLLTYSFKNAEIFEKNPYKISTNLIYKNKNIVNLYEGIPNNQRKNIKINNRTFKIVDRIVI
jgi:hypothetical protein